MKPGTIVKMADGRRGTVVYHGLDGYGIKWGVYNITEKDILGHGGLLDEDIPGNYPYTPDAMLRDPFKYGDKELEYVGEDYTIIREAE